MVDFAPWDMMLRTYVLDGAVDYARWQRESSDALKQWLDGVQAIDVDSMQQEAAIAFLINLYNALTVEQVLQKYPIDSVRPKVFGIPNMASFLLFFKNKIYTLNGQKVSLDDIEHGILREKFNEPRIHFALVCASQSCPSLRNEAYQPNKLNAQLDDNARQFINNPEAVRYDAASQTLYCSKIFDWYEDDFLAHVDSVADYIQPYLPASKIAANAKVEYLPYDWSLNQRISS